jgi:thioredoxin 1
MAVGKVSDSTFENDVLKATGPVVVDSKVTIVKLNVDENPQTAAKYGIMSIPTLMLFKNGELASRQVGAAPKAKLEQWITAAV